MRMSERPTEKSAGAVQVRRLTAPASWPQVNGASGRKTESPTVATPCRHGELQARIEDAAWNEIELLMGAYHGEQALIRGALLDLCTQSSQQRCVTAIQQIVDRDAKLASQSTHQVAR